MLMAEQDFGAVTTSALRACPFWWFTLPVEVWEAIHDVHIHKLTLRSFCPLSEQCSSSSLPSCLRSRRPSSTSRAAPPPALQVSSSLSSLACLRLVASPAISTQLHLVARHPSCVSPYRRAIHHRPGDSVTLSPHPPGHELPAVECLVCYGSVVILLVSSTAGGRWTVRLAPLVGLRPARTGQARCSICPLPDSEPVRLLGLVIVSSFSYFRNNSAAPRICEIRLPESPAY